MKTKTHGHQPTVPATRLPKCPTGIQGLDELTGGGLPRGRLTLVCGAAQFDEPGVLMAFEETETELKANVASLGFDLEGLVRRKKAWSITSTSSAASFRRVASMTWKVFWSGSHAIDSIGGKRVVLDTLEALFASLTNEAIVRSELRRLFRWLKEKGVTAIHRNLEPCS